MYRVPAVNWSNGLFGVADDDDYDVDVDNDDDDDDDEMRGSSCKHKG